MLDWILSAVFVVLGLYCLFCTDWRAKKTRHHVHEPGRIVHSYVVQPTRTAFNDIPLSDFYLFPDTVEYERMETVHSVNTWEDLADMMKYMLAHVKDDPLVVYESIKLSPAILRHLNDTRRAVGFRERTFGETVNIIRFNICAAYEYMPETLLIDPYTITAEYAVLRNIMRSYKNNAFHTHVYSNLALFPCDIFFPAMPAFLGARRDNSATRRVVETFFVRNGVAKEQMPLFDETVVYESLFIPIQPEEIQPTWYPSNLQSCHSALRTAHGDDDLDIATLKVLISDSHRAHCRTFFGQQMLSNNSKCRSLYEDFQRCEEGSLEMHNEAFIAADNAASRSTNVNAPSSPCVVVVGEVLVSTRRVHPQIIHQMQKYWNLNRDVHLPQNKSDTDIRDEMVLFYSRDWGLPTDRLIEILKRTLTSFGTQLHILCELLEAIDKTGVPYPCFYTDAARKFNSLIACSATLQRYIDPTSHLLKILERTFMIEDYRYAGTCTTWMDVFAPSLVRYPLEEKHIDALEKLIIETVNVWTPFFRQLFPDIVRRYHASVAFFNTISFEEFFNSECPSYPHMGFDEAFQNIYYSHSFKVIKESIIQPPRRPLLRLWSTNLNFKMISKHIMDWETYQHASHVRDYRAAEQFGGDKEWHPTVQIEARHGAFERKEYGYINFQRVALSILLNCGWQFYWHEWKLWDRNLGPA